MIKRARERESAPFLLFLFYYCCCGAQKQLLSRRYWAWASTAINSFVRRRFLCRTGMRGSEWVRYVQIIKSWHEWNARAHEISSSLIRMHAAFCRVLVLAAARGWFFCWSSPGMRRADSFIPTDRILRQPAGVCFILLFTSAAFIQFERTRVNFYSSLWELEFDY